jgi:OFA family oxalate/formate antiporter-like MFS transporter
VKAAGILSIIGLVGTTGRIGLGLLSDKMGNRRTVYISFVVMGLAFLGLAFAPSISMLYFFAVVFGCLFGIGVLVVPMVTEYFGFKQLGVISGAFVFSNSMGGAIGPPVAGYIFDVTGKYQIDFIGCGIIGLAAGMIIFMLKPVIK